MPTKAPRLPPSPLPRVARPAARRGGRGRLLLVPGAGGLGDCIERALRTHGFSIRHADSAQDAVRRFAGGRGRAPDFAVLPLGSEAESGTMLLRLLLRANPACRVVTVSDRPDVREAVQAIRLGACDYVAHPVDVTQVLRSLSEASLSAGVDEMRLPVTVPRLTWIHIQNVLAEHGGNVSAAARALQMHRRTLQRKLARPPRPD